MPVTFPHRGRGGGALTIAAEVMADVAMVGRAVPFLATSKILCSHQIQRIPPS